MCSGPAGIPWTHIIFLSAAVADVVAALLALWTLVHESNHRIACWLGLDSVSLPFSLVRLRGWLRGRLRVATIPLLLILAAALIYGAVVLVQRSKSSPESFNTATAPFAVGSYFYPSGWMGDGSFGSRYVKYVSHDGYTKIIYTSGAKGWVGLYWQHPDGNWGQSPGLCVKGAHRLTFWARGKTGTEVVMFRSGGIAGRVYHDSYERSLNNVKLTTRWRRYTIDLPREGSMSVIGAFAWFAYTHSVTFYLKDIRFER